MTSSGPVWQESWAVEEDFRLKYDTMNWQFAYMVYERLGAYPDVVFDSLSILYSYANLSPNQRECEPDCYFYHPDHLGSSSWITDADGKAIQHLHYLPWGEDFVDQRLTDFGSMYTFSAKEKDTETGYSYFGARYYSSDLSVWLSVDPMSDKYPSLSPYVYCADNPVRCVDPNGEEIGDIYNIFGVHIGFDGKVDGKVYLSFVEECKERWTSLKEWNIEDLQSTFNTYRALELHGFSTIATPIGHLCR